MIITISRNRLRPEHQDEYYEMAAKMLDLAKAMPGFVSRKSFEASDGERIAITEFASEETHRAWHQHPEHQIAIKLGRERFYSEFHIQVCSVDKDYDFHHDA
jgi:heme-degrading monooxygenase HmoA